MKIFFVLAALVGISCNHNTIKTPTQEMKEHNTSSHTIYNYKVETITGESLDLASLKGKKVMIVNTASKCGLTPQFEGLEKIYKEYKDDNFVIIGFPSNDFMSQDPGSNDEIAEFCQINYGVSFPMMAKIVVKGKEQHPLYQYLTQKSQNGLDDYEVQWNFQKFLINEQGTIDKVIGPKVAPDDAEIIEWIKR